VEEGATIEPRSHHGHAASWPLEHAGTCCKQTIRDHSQRIHGTNLAPDTEGDGDVKYDLGYGNTRSVANNRKVKVSLLPNPSHLELIDPIQQGIIRCQQESPAIAIEPTRFR